jgi:tetratricopeptide (TPR) repeat protein
MRDVPARQRSLRAVFTSSWDLLTVEEQAVMTRLSPFAGGFTADAASAVAEATPDLLERLLDKSFLRLGENGRYQMHEVLRHYAADALGAETAAVSARFAGYYADFAAAQHKLLNSDRQKEALATVSGEFDNLMAAWRWALEQKDEPLLGRFIDGLWAYLDDRGLYRDGLDLFERALATAPPEPDTEEGVRVWTYLRLAAGFFHQRLGQYPQARRHYERSLQTYRRLADLAQCGHCLYYLGAVAGNSGQLEDALNYLQEALAINQRLESDRRVANTLTKMGSVLELMGRYEDAEQTLRQALALKRESGQPIGIAISLNNLALALWRTGHYDEAETRFREALAINREIGNPGSEAYCLSNLGRVFITRGEYRQAEASLQESLALEQTVQNKRHTASVLNNLGLVSHLLGNGEMAQAYLAQSLVLAHETGNRREATYARLTLARILLDDGDVEGAARSLRRTLQSALDLQLTPLALAALVQAVRLLISRGETARAANVLQLPLHHPAAWHQTRAEARVLAVEPGLAHESGTATAADDLEKTISDLIDTL